MKLYNLVKNLILGLFLGNIVFTLCFENANSNQLSNTATENSALNGGIFSSEGAFKLKNLKKSRNESYLSSRLKNNLSSRLRKNSAYLTNQTKTKATTATSDKSPILHQCWVKYFKYADGVNTDAIPKGFRVNKEFREQKKYYPKSNYSFRNPDGTYDFIRADEYFYLHIFKNTIAINSSKLEKFRKVIDTFNFSDIKPVYEDDKNNKKNGIFDYGKFDEGFCIKISTKDNMRTVWIICNELESEKNELMEILSNLKTEEQHKSGDVLLSPHNQSKQKETLGNLLGNNETTKVPGPEVNVPVDGYWMILQDWSQCNKKCDGGYSTLHRMCVAPKHNGKPCEGLAIINKECNTQACPDLGDNANAGQGGLAGLLGGNNKNTKVLKPIVKTMPFTDSPQRYTLCKIKESDIMVYEEKKDLKKEDNPLMKGKSIDTQDQGIEIPTRIVMNTKTITVYAGEHFETLYISFNIKQTRLIEVKKKKNCFMLAENSTKSVVLCPYGCDMSRKVLDEWKKDFDLFKNKCDRIERRELSDDEQKALDKKIKDAMDEAKRKALDEAAGQRQLKKANRSEVDLLVLVKNTHNVALQAMQKEMNLEDLIKQEQEEKNRLEEERIRKLIEAERKKKECVMKAIKERQLEKQLNDKAKEIQQTIGTIKQEAAQQVLLKRNNLKKILNQINQKASLKRNQLRQELQNVKLQIANELGKVYKKGDTQKCIDAMANTVNRIHYCTANYAEDFSNLSFCKTTDDFCDMCCESEFGQLSGKKESCMATACPPNSEKKKDITESNGRWVWQSALN